MALNINALLTASDEEIEKLTEAELDQLISLQEKELRKMELELRKEAGSIAKFKTASLQIKKLLSKQTQGETPSARLAIKRHTAKQYSRAIANRNLSASGIQASKIKGVSSLKTNYEMLYGTQSLTDEDWAEIYDIMSQLEAEGYDPSEGPIYEAIIQAKREGGTEAEILEYIREKVQLVKEESTTTQKAEKFIEFEGEFSDWKSEFYGF